MVGIVSYGAYIPHSRIKTDEIALTWIKSGEEVKAALGVFEKSVPAYDEDAVTLAYEAARQSLAIFKGKFVDIDVVLVGSESHPYAVNPTATIVGDILGIGNTYLAADLEFACKGGTAGIQLIAGLIAKQQFTFGLAIGTDTAQSKPHDQLEYASAAASGALLLGSKRVAVELVDFCSFSSDTPDFWRRDGMKYPLHAGRFTGEPAYFTHVQGAARMLLNKTGISVGVVDYCLFHMPNGKFPREVAKRLGFVPKQLESGLTVSQIGNPYSASTFVGLANILDRAIPGQTIFMVSYGSGAGSDAFLWKVTPEVKRLQTERKKARILVQDFLNNKTYINYIQYLKQTHKL